MPRLIRLFATAALATTLMAYPRHASAEPPPARAALAASSRPWSASAPEVAARVRATKTFVVRVVVPLCSNEQIDCGGAWAGHPEGSATNVYWGAIFGARRFLERPDRGWERVDLSKPGKPILEQAVLRRLVRGAVWGVEGDVEALVVLQAYHGALINEAVDALWEAALSGGTVTFHDGARERREPVSVVAYAGHNRLMDGLRLPAPPAVVKPIPSVVLACMSEKHFGVPLRGAGSPTLLTTRAYMAPEGYVIDAVAKALAENRSVDAIRAAAVDATSHWQRTSRAQADGVFAKTPGTGF